MSDSSSDLSNFTPNAQKVLALAYKEAERFNHNFVGTEHLLLAIIKLRQGTAVNVLQTLGSALNFDLETIRFEIEKQVGTGPDQKMIGNIPHTPRVKKILILARKEATSLNHKYVGTEHLLIGLIREGEGVAARVLINLPLDVETVRLAVLKELDPNTETKDKTMSETNEKTEPVELLDTYLKILALRGKRAGALTNQINLLQVQLLLDLANQGMPLDCDIQGVTSGIFRLIHEADDLPFLRLCANALAKILKDLGEDLGEHPFHVVEKAFRSTTYDSPAFKNFGTVLQLLTGNPVEINFSALWPENQRQEKKETGRAPMAPI